MAGANNEVWVFVEQRDSKPADVSFELLSKGRKLADAMGGLLKSVVIGDAVKAIAVETFQFGADECMLVQHPVLKDYKTLPYSRILNDLIKRHTPRIVLFGATITGRDLAPRVASNTLSGLTADCTDLKMLLQIRPAFGGNIIATIITPDNPIQMATVREGVMEKHLAGNIRDVKMTEIPYTPDRVDDLVTIVERQREESKVNLKNAPIIVAGGYGIGTKENFKLIYELAHVLGGEVAGSRAAVDAGFIPHERQVGQTGVTVRPKLYFAIGISGAIQHRAGMQEAKKIIAINSDPDAPIFDVSHYGIVGDAMDVIPKFIDVYRQKLK
jgi:electron transfer flavoprotein alpha subunit